MLTTYLLHAGASEMKGKCFSLEVRYPSMAVVAEFTVETGDFPLGSIFDTHPDATVELERLVPIGRNPIPYFWVEGVRSDDLVSAFEKHSEVKSIRILDEINGDCLLRVDWSSEGHGMLRALTDSNVSLLSTTGSSDGWTFEVRAESGDIIREFDEYCHGNDISVHLQKYHRLVPGDTDTDDLTTPQQEALLLAYERGYYQSPRQSTLEEMASELGITGQSFGSRLQRGTHRLIGNTLLE